MTARSEDERVPAQTRGAPDGRPRRRLVLAGITLIGLLAVAAVAGVVSSSKTTDSGSKLAPGEVAGPFGQHYAGLAVRRKSMEVTTMMDTMSSDAHVHPKLTIMADGKPVPIPANIGIDPRQDGMSMASLHTHDDPGIIHVEGMSAATLGQFFAVWGVPLSADRLGSYREPVRMWVNGKRSEAFGKLKLADKQKIVLAVGRGDPSFE